MARSSAPSGEWLCNEQPSAWIGLRSGPDGIGDVAQTFAEVREAALSLQVAAVGIAQSFELGQGHVNQGVFGGWVEVGHFEFPFEEIRVDGELRQPGGGQVAGHAS